MIRGASSDPTNYLLDSVSEMIKPVTLTVYEAQMTQINCCQS